MSSPFNYQVFSGVASRETFLGNIRTTAEANGWTVDKDTIASQGELYIHSTGNGHQNLYFSFKIQQAYNDTSKKYLVWHCNTGYDGGKAWNAQPGRFSVIPKTCYLEDNASWYHDYYSNNDPGYLSSYDGGDFAVWIPTPCSEQYVFANSQAIIVTYRVIHVLFQGTTLAGYGAFVVGAMDSENGSSETELNFTLATSWGHCGYIGGMFVPWMIIPDTGMYPSWDTRNTIIPFGLLYNGSGQVTLPSESGNGYSGSSLKMFASSVSGITALSIGRSNNSCVGQGYYSYVPLAPQGGPDYSGVLLYNPGMARVLIHKPNITILDPTGETFYCYPSRASLPYYACVFSPYHKGGDTISVGSRTFMVFPLFRDTDTIGYAIEIS